MSQFDAQIAALDQVCLNEFGDTATFIPQDGSGSISITGIFSDPPMSEDFGAATGATSVWFFVELSSITPTPRRGDQISINSVTYDLADVISGAVGGGATLKLRKSA